MPIKRLSNFEVFSIKYRPKPNGRILTITGLIKENTNPHPIETTKIRLIILEVGFTLITIQYNGINRTEET